MKPGGVSENADVLKKYRLEEFIKIVEATEAIEAFDINLYFKITEKMIVFEGDRVVVMLLDGTEVECKIE